MLKLQRILALIRRRKAICHGTCQLVEAIEKQEAEDNKSPFASNSLKKVNKLQWFFENDSHRILIAHDFKNKLIVYTKNSILNQYHSGIFRPPQA